MALARVAFDDFVDTFPTNLDLHTPDLNIPGGWEYGGGSAGWTVESPGRAQRQPAGGRYVRSKADITAVVFTGPFTVEADIVKGAVDSTVADGLIGFFQRGSGSAAPYDGEGIWVGWERLNASTVNVVARRVNAGGGIAETLIFGTTAVPPNRRYTFAVAADGVTITATVSDLFTGLNPVGFGNVVLGADIRDADHRRIGLSGRDVGSSVTDIYQYDLLQDAALLNPWSVCEPCAAGGVWTPTDLCN